MLANILTASLRDRWLSTVIGTSIVGAFLVLGMAAYGQIDLAVYTDLPEAMRAVMGIPDGADPAVLAYSVIYGMVGAMTLAGVAISIGASTVAGEERDGTIGLLLGNPRSRHALLASKVGAMVLLTTLGGLITLGFGYLAPALIGTAIGGAHVAAMVAHMTANALFFGLLAAAVGAWTGNRAGASATAAGTMILSYFIVGLLPLFASVAGLAKLVPWYWFDGHDPLNNGLGIGWLALQLGLAAGFVATAWFGVQRRDLRRPTGTTSLRDRILEHPLLTHPTVGRLVERLSGGARVSNIWVVTASQGRPLLIITSVVMFTMMGLMMGPMYAALEGTLAGLTDGLPDALLAVMGGGDMATPEGWYQLETFGLMAPIAITLVAGAVGARALAGEEQRRTMGLLLANPVRRSRIVLEKALAMTIHAVIVGAALFLGVAGGSLLGGLGMDLGNIAATSLLATLLGLLFGTVALVLSAGTGRVRYATLGTIGVAGTAYAANAILGIADGLGRYRWLSPFDWYLGTDPLLNGMSWGHGALFVGLIVGLTGLAVLLFERRDLRTT